jgi:hypothetical protein
LLTLSATPPQLTYSTPEPQSASLSPIVEDDYFMDGDPENESEFSEAGCVTSSQAPELVDIGAWFPERQELVDTIAPQIEVARHFRQADQRYEAECAYLKAIKSTEHERLLFTHSSNASLLQCLNEFREYLSNSTGKAIPTSTVHCLKLYQLCSLYSILDTAEIVTPVVLILCHLLQRHPKLPLRDLICTATADILLKVSKTEEKGSLCRAFPICLEQALVVYSAAFPPGSRVFFFFLVIFTWKLLLLLQGRAGTTAVSYDPTPSTCITEQLKAIAGQFINVVHNGSSWEDCIVSSVITISQLLNQDIDTVLSTECLTSLLTAMTPLARICSLRGDNDAATFLFKTILCVDMMLEPWDNQIQLHIEYCQHLARLLQWKELVVALCLMCNKFHGTWLRRHTQGSFDDILQTKVSFALYLFATFPYPHDKYLLLRERSQLRDLEEELTAYLEPGRRREHVFVMPPLRDEAFGFDTGDEDKSSHKYGTTYTGSSISGMSGISFNYSDLWK